MEFHWFDIVTLGMTFIFVYGLIQNSPLIFIQINFLIKVFISIYLMYRFNDFRRITTITVLDQKICSSAGVYLFIFSFADVITAYFNKIRNYIMNTYL